jgi:hypothetical protein
MADREHQPGAPAPRTGRYQELNVFGTPTGKVVDAEEDSRLPAASRGFSWRHVVTEVGWACMAKSPD